MSDSIELLDEAGRWRARNVKYWRGRWDQVREQIPVFETEDFRANAEGPANPHLKAVVRQPKTLFEKPVPVGVVSHTYSLAQHGSVAERCFVGIRSAGVNDGDLTCEVGLTELGEWMNLRIYFPDRFSHEPYDGNKIRLRLECFNSVDGSSRLVILLSWLRVICSNGMVIRETKAEIRDIHNERLDIDRIPVMIRDAMGLVEDDIRRLSGWQEVLVEPGSLKQWVNTTLAKWWGKKAACRTFHICTSGFDVEYEDPFAPGEPTEKPVKKTKAVPGAPQEAGSLYDVSQALSWIATSRTNPEERIEWQSAIPELIDALMAA